MDRSARPPAPHGVPQLRRRCGAWVRDLVEYGEDGVRGAGEGEVEERLLAGDMVVEPDWP
ncbi:hypothetical protein [Streptomyces sp. AK04-3B]|uniref:hypothetical protein n=1 Tax=Streptomyces sp. AK04-3B TaxID=3028650 RepID=UPI0029C09939|nr:hypothetical protein [Streptomyces sp. AK04-3B]